MKKRNVNLLARLVLGELPVDRIRENFQYRSSLGAFRSTSYGKRACLYCLLGGDTLVLGFVWDWIFDCPLFSELQMEFPSFVETLQSFRSDSGFSEVSDLSILLYAI